MNWGPSLNISSRRAIVRSMMPKLVVKFPSANAALGYLINSPVGGIRKTDFLADWRQFLGIKRKRDPLKHVRKSYVPSSAVIESTHDNQSKRYKAVYKVTGELLSTGEIVEYEVSVVSDKMRRMGTWDLLAEVVARGEKYSQEYNILSIERDAMYERLDT